MLEEKNDNLQLADGQQNENDAPSDNESVNTTQEIENKPSEVLSSAEEKEVVSADEVSEEELDHEEELNSELPLEDYDLFSLEQLSEKLKYLVSNYSVSSIKDHVDAIRKTFYNKYNDQIEAKKNLFFAENPDANEGDFQYELPVKTTFDQTYALYRNNKNKHYKNIQDTLKQNLSARLAIIDELKELIDNTENYGAALKDIQNLRDRWKSCGAIPRDNYNHVWNNFHFHIERFYDQLHLDREARDLDFKHNLEQKQHLIEKAKELLEEENIQKAFREMQLLHRVWKEQVGPVDREHRESIWNEFSDITKQLHEKREVLNEQIKEKEENNLKEKQAIVAEIKLLEKQEIKNHSQWQQGIKKIEDLRKKFFAVGRVPNEANETVWEEFKEATRDFNSKKNNFYKDIKKDQQDNLNKKLALIEKAKSLNESDDFEKVTPVMKQIQEDWKRIGHVPKKQSDEIWKEFKQACNHYFDRLHSVRNETIEAEMENFEKKKDFLESLKSFELSGTHKTDLEAIKQHIATWKEFGPVPQSRRHVEGKFNRILDTLFEKLSMSKREAELVKFSNRVEQLTEEKDFKRIQNELVFVQRKIDEVQSDIFQLENNIQFFQNAKSDNPLLKEINKNIERHREELHLWKEKLVALRNITEQKL